MEDLRYVFGLSPFYVEGIVERSTGQRFLRGEVLDPKTGRKSPCVVDFNNVSSYRVSEEELNLFADKCVQRNCEFQMPRSYEEFIKQIV